MEVDPGPSDRDAERSDIEADTEVTDVACIVFFTSYIKPVTDIQGILEIVKKSNDLFRHKN